MSENEKVYIRNQRIYKKYAGQFEELKKLELWMVNYHKLITKIVTKGKIDEIKTLAKEIRLEFDYKDYQSWNINITELDEILIDFLQQFSIMCGNEYYDFSIMENDKLVLYNIVEKYINTLKGCSYKFKNLKKFVKITKNSLDLVIPKTKKSNFFDSFMQRYIRVAILIAIFMISICVLMLLVYSMLNEHVFDSNVAWIISILLSFILTIILVAKYGNYCYNKLPELEFSFARDSLEKKEYLSDLSIIISILILISNIVFNLFF